MVADKLKCCGCNKETEIDAPLKDGIAQSFGKYHGSLCYKIICVNCIKYPQKRKEYEK